jgi:transcriptional regulator with XRE-family HTH domain
MPSQTDILLRNKVIGAKIRQVRNEAGLSLKETSARIGTNPSRLSSYERGERPISLPELELFAFHMNRSIKQFLSVEAVHKPSGADVNPDVMLSLRNRMIGAMLKTHRTEANLSIRKLSKELDLPPSRISAYERGSRSVPIVDLELIAERLGHRLEDYFDHNGPLGIKEQDHQAVSMLANLQPELREFLSNPVNEPYLRIAKRLSELDVGRLRTVAEGLLEITL